MEECEPKNCTIGGLTPAGFKPDSMPGVVLADAGCDVIDKLFAAQDAVLRVKMLLRAEARDGAGFLFFGKMI